MRPSLACTFIDQDHVLGLVMHAHTALVPFGAVPLLVQPPN